MRNVTSHGTIGGEGTIMPTTANRTVYDKADNLTTYVNGIRQSLNAWHIDLLAHSTGGLVARLYVHKQMDVLPDGHPVALHLMMLGTPNNGVPCADSMGLNDAFKNQMQTAKELMPEEMALFNQYVNQRKGTKFSALVGNSFPILCASPQWNDGFVSVESASYGVEDVTLTSQKHPDMVSTETFNGFVRAHVITGPRGTYPYAAASQK
jgi:esterase/lipase superfamily enzyme